MYIYIYIYTYIHVYICVHIYTCICIHIHIHIYIYIEREIIISLYYLTLLYHIYVNIATLYISGGTARSGGGEPRRRARAAVVSIVSEAPFPKRSFGDKTSLYAIHIYSDKQQLSHNVGWLHK